MANTIQIKRGAASGLPALVAGELAFTTDTFRLYVGSAGGNKLVGEADFVKLSGSTMTGALTLSGAPVNDLHAATKAYVDAARTGLAVKAACRVATAAALPAHGAISANVITASANGVLTIDGVAVALNDRILVKDEGGGTHAENGIYFVSQLGTASVPWKLTRVTDADESAEVKGGMFVFVSEGTANADAGFVLTTNDPITLNTTALTFTQFSGAGQITAGNGLTKTGNQIDVGAGQGIQADADSITVKLDGATLTKSASGLKVTAGGITATELASAVAGNGLTGGGGTALAVNTGTGLEISSDAVRLATQGDGIAGGAGTTLSANIDTTAGLKFDASSPKKIQVSINATAFSFSSGALTPTFGTGAGQFCQGNDARLSDARTPTAHAVNASTYGYGDATNAGHLRVGTGLSVATGTISVTYGSTANTACQGNDSRLHTQNTDTGTSSTTFQIGTGGPKLKNTSGNITARNAADDGNVSLYASVLGSIATDGYTGSLSQPSVGGHLTHHLPSVAGTLLNNKSTIDGGTW